MSKKSSEYNLSSNTNTEISTEPSAIESFLPLGDMKIPPEGPTYFGVKANPGVKRQNILALFLMPFFMILIVDDYVAL